MKLTKSQKKMLERIRDMPVMLDDQGAHLTNGESVHSGVFKRLIDKGAVIASQDGLLEGFTQTYRAAQ